MSKVVDERVVVLNFDNKKFEKNTKKTMKSIDKLKKSLVFDDVSDSINDAYKKADPSILSTGIDKVNKKFTLMEIAAISAVNRITNKVMNMGERFVKSLSIDNIISGWQSYEEEVKSVGTLLGQGYDSSVVTKQLELLTKYTDATSYSYTDMANNISKFTAAGVDLDKATQAMMGIANWAAVSGQNAQKASSAMYQLAQAIGAGTVKLQDWKSIQNVSMDTREFREQVLETAVAMKTLKKNADGTYKTLSGKTFNINQFTSQMSEGWFTSDVLVSTLEKYSAAVNDIFKIQEDNNYDTVEEAARDYERQIKELQKQVDEFGDVTGKTQKRIDEMNFALKTFRSAQEARTFTDAVNATKDAVKSSRRATFNNIFGGYEEAKETWSQMANDFYDIFASQGNKRNALLRLWGDKSLVKKDAKETAETILGQISETIGDNHSMSLDQWKSFTDSIGGASNELKQAMIDAAVEAGNIVKEADGIYRAVDGTVVSIEKFDDSLAAGWVNAQNLNKTIENIKKQSLGGREDLFGAKQYTEDGKYIASASGAIWNLLEGIKSLMATVKSAWTDVFGERSAEGLKTITERIQQFSAKLVPASGIFERMKNILKGVFSIGKLVVKIANGLFTAIKPIFSVFQKSGDGAVSIIEKLAIKFTDFVNTIEQNETFIDIMNTVSEVATKVAGFLIKAIDFIGKGISKIWPVASKIFKMVISGILSIVKFLGYLIENIYNFIKDTIIAIKQSERFAKVVDTLRKVFKKLYETAKQVFDKFKEYVNNIKNSKIADIIRNACNKIANAFVTMVNRMKGSAEQEEKSKTGASAFLDRIKEKLKVLEPIFTGLKNLWTGIKNLFSPLVKLVGRALTALGNFLTAVGERIQGFLDGKNGLISFGELIKTVFKVGIAAILTKWVTSVLNAITKLVNGFSMFLTGFKGHSILERVALAMKQFAIAMLAFTAAIIILSKLDTAQVSKAMGAITAILAMYVGFIMSIKKLFVVNKRTSKGFGLLERNKNGGRSLLNKRGGTSEGPAETISAISGMLLAMAASMLIISIAVKTLTSLDENRISSAISILIVIMGMMAVFVQQLKAFIKDNKSKMVAPGIMTFIGIAILMKSLAKTMLTIANIEDEAFLKGAAGILIITAAMSVVIRALAKLSASVSSSKKKTKNVSSATKSNGSMFMIVGVLISLTALYSKMTESFKDIGSMSWEEIKVALTGLTIITVSLLSLLYVLSRFDTKNVKGVKKIIGAMGSIVILFTAMTLILKYITTIPKEDIGTSLGVLLALTGMVLAVLTVIGIITKLTKKAKVGKKPKTSVGQFIGISILLLAITNAIVQILHATNETVRVINDTGVDIFKNEDDMDKMLLVVGLSFLYIASVFAFSVALIKSSKKMNAKSIVGLSLMISTIVGLLFTMMLALKVATKAVTSTNSMASLIVSMTFMETLLITIFAGIIALANFNKGLTTQKTQAIKSLLNSITLLLLSMSAIIMAVGIMTVGNNYTSAIGTLFISMLIIVGTLFSIVQITKKLDNSKIKNISEILLAITASIAILAIISKMLDKVNMESIGKLALLALILIAFAGIGALFSKLGLGPGLLLIAGAMLVFAAAIWLVADAIDKLVNAAEKLNSLDLDADKMSKNLEAFATALKNNAKILGEALGTILVGILESFFSRIVTFVERVMSYIGTLAAPLGYAIANLIGGIFKGLAETDAMGSLVDMFLDMISVFLSRLPEIADQLITTAIELLVVLERRVPEIMANLVSLAWTVIINFIDALADSIMKNIERLKSAMTKFGQACIDGFKALFGINSPSSLFAEFGTYIWQGLVNGLSGMWNGVKKVFVDFWGNVTGWFKQNIIEPFKNFGKNIIDGLLGGIQSAWNGLTSWCEKNFGWIGDTFAKIFNIHSPSRVFEQYGEYMVEGLQIGLEETSGVAKAVEHLGDTVNNEMEKSDLNSVIADMFASLNSDIDDDLVITPVLDLSNIQNGATEIGNLMKSFDGYSIEGTNRLASDISSSMNHYDSNRRNKNSGNTTNNTNNNENVYNTFNITGTNAKEIADEVSKELQRQVNRRNKSWA